MKAILLLVLFASSQLYGMNYAKGDSLFVIRFEGDFLYSQPSQDAKQVAFLVQGEGVAVINKQKNSSFFILDTDELLLDGHWVKVNYKGIKGYVFDANCLDYRLDSPIEEPSLALMKTAINPFGLLMKKEGIARVEIVEGQTYAWVDSLFVFQNGSYHKCWDAYGCYQEVFKLNTGDFNLLYHYLTSINYNTEYKNEAAYFVFSHLLKEEDNSYFFSEINGRSELNIKLNVNGSAELSYLVCI